MDDVATLHLQELRRGTVVLACLLILERPGYGYGLLETLDRAGFAVDANTLYPLLRRLEKQGLLTSEWDTADVRPRKFYRTTESGGALAGILRQDLAQLNSAIHDLTPGETR